VTIEVSELIYYTSEEEDEEESDYEEFRLRSLDSRIQLKKALTGSKRNLNGP
jgi:hypothetical protein